MVVSQNSPIRVLLLPLCIMALDFFWANYIEAKIVKTISGDIEGFTQSCDGVLVDTYYGIPFATPPLGILRFRAPLPLQNWSGVKDARKLPNSCMQSPDTNFDRFSGVEMWNPNTNISEDCLYINLWVPRGLEGEKLTTMMWMFGGSFVYGTVTLDVYDGRYLAAKKSVIVASMQFRMGVHGFLYSGTDDAPGNMGLLDQQMAMKWIYNNIEQFGGDNSKITLFGESSGAVSVSHHMLAPSSWPYFHNAIMLSSTSFAPWAWETPENLHAKFKLFAIAMGCERDSNREIMKCLRDAQVEDLEAKQWELNNDFVGTFIPVIDGVFLKDTPANLISSGIIKDMDILLGGTKDEGEFFLVYLFQEIIKPENLWNPQDLHRTEYKEIVKKIIGYGEGLVLDGVLYTYEYSNLPSFRGTYMEILNNMLGDYLFKCSVHDFAVQFSNLNETKGTTYLYSFDYRHSINPWPSWMGVLHGYEIELLFGLPFNPRYNYTSEDRIVSDYVMEYFTSFSKTGSPNTQTSPVVWPEFTAYSEKHIVFTQEATIQVSEDFRSKECAFWRYLSPTLQAAQDLLSANNGSEKYVPTIAICNLVIVILLIFVLS